MATVIVLDQLTINRVILFREKDANGVLGNVVAEVSYTVADVEGRIGLQRAVTPPINATRQAQLKTLWDDATNYVKNVEGL